MNNPSIYVVFLQNKDCPGLCYHVSEVVLFGQKCPRLCYLRNSLTTITKPMENTGRCIILTSNMSYYDVWKDGRNRLKNNWNIKQNVQMCPTYGVLTLDLDLAQ